MGKRTQSIRGVVCSLGWGVDVGWGLCLFFSSSMSGNVVSTRLSWIVSLAFSSLAFLMIVLAPKSHRNEGPTELPSSVIVWISAAAISTGTVLFCILPAHLLVARAAAVALTAVANASMNIRWGLCAASLDIDTVERTAVLVTAPMLVCYAFGSALAPLAACAFIACLPFISAAMMRWFDALDAPSRDCVVKLERDSTTAKEGRAAGISTTELRWGAGIAAIASCVSLLWTVERMSWGGFASAFTYNALAIAGIALAGTVVAIYTRFSSHVSLTNLQRVLLPGIIACYAITTVHSRTGSLIAYALSMMVQTFLDLAVWVLFVELCIRESGPMSRTIALGRLSIQTGLLVGCAISITFGRVAPSMVTVELFTLAVMCAIVMVSTGERDNAARNAPDPQSSTSPDYSELWQERLEAFAKKYALTVRETQVLGYVVKGHTQAYVRDAIGISKNTVDTHARHIYRKCSVHSKEELIEMFDREG